DEVTGIVARSKKLFTKDFFSGREGFGSPSPDPIFVVGMPRSGSTLIEQILASHPAIEGTMELPDIPSIARRFGARRDHEGEDLYPAPVAGLGAADCAALGTEYLDRTRVQRKTGRPFFIDKLPNNWINIGLIHLILPRAKIIDARRHPLDCCFSNFKQHYARGQGFSYALEDMARYYSDYVDLLAHFDAVLPGRVHRIHHEQLIEDPEGEIRRLLDHLGLAFDPACLSFHLNRRAVRTASSEQVRRPINREGLGQWRHYERWLAPLTKALAGVVADYPVQL
ncbi:MAG: sulfotransferase family protein, partial [Sphingomonadales bacterium]